MRFPFVILFLLSITPLKNGLSQDIRGLKYSDVYLTRVGEDRNIKLDATLPSVIRAWGKPLKRSIIADNDFYRNLLLVEYEGAKLYILNGKLHEFEITSSKISMSRLDLRPSQNISQLQKKYSNIIIARPETNYYYIDILEPSGDQMAVIFDISGTADNLIKTIKFYETY